MMAFPDPHRTDIKGMTLRDYYAAKAMQAFISGWIGCSDYPETDMVVAEYAYSMADAMLKVREENATAKV